MTDKIIITEEILRQISTSKGGVSLGRKHFKFFKMKYPAEKGWKNYLIGREISNEDLIKLLKITEEVILNSYKLDNIYNNKRSNRSNFKRAKKFISTMDKINELSSYKVKNVKYNLSL